MLDESVWGHMEDSALDGVSEGEDCGASATSVLEFPVGEAGSADGEEEGESPSAASRAPTMAPDVAAAVAIGAVPVRIFGLRCGVAELEVQHGGVLTQARPLLVLPNAEAAAEVERLAAKARGADWVDAFLRDVGLVVGYLQGEGAAGQCSAEVVAPIAARTVEFSLERGCTALARLLQPALAEESGQCGGRSSDAFAAAASCNPPAQKSTWEELGAKMGAMGQSLKGAAAALCAATGVSDFAAARTAAIEREVLRNVDVRGNGGMDWGWVPAAAATFCGLAAAVAARNWGGA